MRARSSPRSLLSSLNGRTRSSLASKTERGCYSRCLPAERRAVNLCQIIRALGQKLPSTLIRSRAFSFPCVPFSSARGHFFSSSEFVGRYIFKASNEVLIDYSASCVGSLSRSASLVRNPHSIHFLSEREKRGPRRDEEKRFPVR